MRDLSTMLDHLRGCLSSHPGGVHLRPDLVSVMCVFLDAAAQKARFLEHELADMRAIAADVDVTLGLAEGLSIGESTALRRRPRVAAMPIEEGGNVLLWPVVPRPIPEPDFGGRTWGGRPGTDGGAA